MFMLRSILHRLIQMIVVLFVISTLTFILMKLSPGNPVDKILHLDVAHVSAEQINATEEKLGLKDSLVSQWWQWMKQLFQLNLGRSIETKEPVTQSLFEYAPPTLLISFSTLILSLAISIPLGVLSAIRYHKLTDKVIRTVATLSISLPAFFIGIILLFIFTNLLNIDSILWNQFILPVFTLSLGMCAYIIRLVRSNLLTLYQSNVVKASRLRGMSERYILIHDLLKPTLLPIIPLLGISLGSLIGGTVVIENLFDIPGIGYLLMDSIKSRDYPIIQGCVLFIGFFVVLINTIADLLSLSLDPKQRLHFKNQKNNSNVSSILESGDQHD
ncbi:ABC transporter permease [Staphylococcus argenteus]|nr:nickel ABC transporter permease [Staphylococcus argenteus]GJF43914.1 ABC transporter permease [Staphylococcus argenteus]GJF54142.1 ABC transporter permease [Staphylococcus argenteus]GJF59569.1 ABC transporter permease [Staphylococcus argenteus]GJF72470.1 ABC transporter permease [Staphylococcus argenteus]GJF85357.1 ABC transporter permease [Staphylococcus argenteus]